MTYKKVISYLNGLFLSTSCFLLSGCGGGGGGGTAALGGLFGGPASDSLANATPPPGAGSEFLPLLGSGETIAQAHNPEPASMLLMGGGMIAMAYFRNKMKNGQKMINK